MLKLQKRKIVMSKMQLSGRVKTAQIVLAVILAASVDAAARERSVTRSHSGTDISRSTTVTGVQGKSVSLERTMEMDAGTLKKNATVTGPNGQTAERNSTATRTEDGYVKSTSVTGPQGNTATREAQGSWNPETKTWTKSVSVTESEQQETE
jgi:hypothetical protein